MRHPTDDSSSCSSQSWGDLECQEKWREAIDAMESAEQSRRELEASFIAKLKMSNFHDPHRIYNERYDADFVNAAHIFLMREVFTRAKAAAERGETEVKEHPYLYLLYHLQFCTDRSCRNWVQIGNFYPITCGQAQKLYRHLCHCKSRHCPVLMLEDFIRSKFRERGVKVM